MDIYELVEKLGGEIVGNVAQVRQGKDYTVLAKHDGVDFVFTDVGQRLANEVEEPKPAKRGRKPKGLVVESVEPTFEVDLDV